MDSFEWTKILGAILGTLLFLFVVKEAAHIIYPAEEEAEELAYKIEIPETEAEAVKEEPEQVDLGALLRQASAEQGESVAKRCLQCHTFEKGGPNKTGPNLWGVLGRDIAAKSDFRYSSALSQMEGEWTYERVYEFVGAPSRYAPGTSMNFAGLRRQQQRINLLAYLRTQTDEPPPLPEPLPGEEEKAESPEGEGASETGTDGAAAGAEDESATEEAAGEEGGDAADGEDAGAAQEDDADSAGSAETEDAPEAGEMTESGGESSAGEEPAPEAEDDGGGGQEGTR